MLLPSLCPFFPAVMMPALSKQARQAILGGTTTIASCGFDDGMISLDLIGGAEPYNFEWTDDTGMLVSIDSLETTVGTGTYTVLITDASGCYDSAVAYAETLDSVSYLWSPEMGVSCLDCPITYLSPYETTTYTLMMTQAGGCMS